MAKIKAHLPATKPDEVKSTDAPSTLAEYAATAVMFGAVDASYALGVPVKVKVGAVLIVTGENIGTPVTVVVAVIKPNPTGAPAADGATVLR